ncbi:hypothetical protein FALBO_1665 [Fusarium albosuccineum]|uniref:Uncharacterized protein n=1 Tax=Fusarium albosuccineum TaxID=1237068 RepID=A0A8H4LPJ7_9HYPO|nr:hypothetical protein FALBO_1665 [Fusarium albosuccineum]
MECGGCDRGRSQERVVMSLVKGDGLVRGREVVATATAAIGWCTERTVLDLTVGLSEGRRGCTAWTPKPELKLERLKGSGDDVGGACVDVDVEALQPRSQQLQLQQECSRDKEVVRIERDQIASRSNNQMSVGQYQSETKEARGAGRQGFEKRAAR